MGGIDSRMKLIFTIRSVPSIRFKSRRWWDRTHHTSLFFNEEEELYAGRRTSPKGAKVKFSLPPDLDVVDAVVNTARQLKEQSLNEADALIIFPVLAGWIPLVHSSMTKSKAWPMFGKYRRLVFSHLGIWPGEKWITLRFTGQPWVG